jgi:hypothetical protein
MTEEKKSELEAILVKGRALRDAMIFIYQSDAGNIWRFASYETFSRKYNDLSAALAKHTLGVAVLDYFDLEKMKGPFDTLAIAQKVYFDTILANLSLLISITEHELGAQTTELGNLLDFLQSRVRRAVLKDPEREKDIQDVVEQLLIGRGFTKGVDYDREVGRVKVSAKEVVPDFIFPKLGLALEVKILKDVSNRSNLIDGINADIQAYAKSYVFVAFLVYDMGAIRDEVEFKQGLDNQKNIFILIIKH